MQSQYAYILMTDTYAVLGVFSWPNVVKKFIRDTYTVNGSLHLPPEGRLKLTRYRVNPKVGQPVSADLLHIGAFLDS